MHGNDAVIAHLLGRRQRGGQLGGMVGVVIDDDRAVALALDLKAAARAVELLGCANGVLGLEAQRAHAAAHGQRIVNVVVAGHAQLDVGEVLTEFEDIELKEAGLVLADVDGAETGLLLDAEAQTGRSMEFTTSIVFLSSMLKTTVRDSSANFWNASLSLPIVP